jgi:hypothetical protein
MPTGSAEVDISTASYHYAAGCFTNAFDDNDITSSINKCDAPKAFKNVYAKKTWHGKRPYTAPYFRVVDTTEWCCNCSRLEYDSGSQAITKHANITFATPFDDVSGGHGDDNKYLTFFARGEYEYSSSLIEYSAWYESTSSVNRYSGNKTVSCTSGSAGEEGYGEYALPEAADSIGLADTNFSNIYSVFCESVLGGQWWSGNNEPTTKTGDGAQWTITFVSSDPNIYCSIDCDLDSDITVEYYGYLGDGSPGRLSYLHYSYTETTFAYEKRLKTGTLGFSSEQRWYAEGLLSDAYSRQDVVDDLANLLNQWELGDDVRYPWRDDSAVTSGPMVSYGEPDAAQVPVVCDSTQSYCYTSNILGAPSQTPVDKWWNPTHVNYEVCYDSYTDYWYKFEETYGDWSTSGYVPCATQWTNKLERSFLPQGAFAGANCFYISMNSFGAEGRIEGDTYYACKWAELILPKPSFNFARPCGLDRLQPSGSEYCIKSYTTESVYVEDGWGETITDIADNSYILIAGIDETMNGIWKVTTDGNYTITLTQQYASASWIPSYPFDDTRYESGKVIKLKYPSCSPICGRVDATFTAPTTTSLITCSLLEPQWMWHGDTLAVVDTPAGYESIKGDYEIIISSSTLIYLQSSANKLTTPTTGLFQLKGSGSNVVDWKYNDSSTKGDYVTAHWIHNYRDVGEYNRMLTQSSSLSSGYTCDYLIPPDYTYETCPDGYVISEPRPNNAGAGQYQSVVFDHYSQSCFPVRVCQPVVSYFSPNSESRLENNYLCHNAGWIWTTLDPKFGNLWQGMVRQYDDDYLYEPHPCICEDDTYGYKQCVGNWEEDTGFCLPDDGLVDNVKYYWARGQVEARTDAPSGVDPSFRNKIRYLTVENISSFLDSTYGRVWTPPHNSGGANVQEMTYTVSLRPYWEILAMKNYCVNVSGRFADEYARQGYGDEIIEEEI